MTAVHQIVPIVQPGAVTAHTLVAQRLLREAGYESEIFTALYGSEDTFGARQLSEYNRCARAGDRLVYQMAIGSTAADFVAERQETLVVNYHNMTPLQYFAGWEPVAAHGVAWGRQQLRQLAARATLGIPVSRYNDADLLDAGFAQTTIVPFLIDPATLTVEPDADVLADLMSTRAGAQWVFVGRIAPNKAQHDIVKAFAAFRRFHDHGARLHLVGGGDDTTYGAAIRRFADSLDLADAVVLTGAVDPHTLAAHYQAADVFVSCSEHEGFCVPLLEAMHHDVPIVAFAAAAVPETVENAGLLLPAKDAGTVALAVARVLDDDRLHTQLVRAGRERKDVFALANTGPAFVEATVSA